GRAGHARRALQLIDGAQQRRLLLGPAGRVRSGGDAHDLGVREAGALADLFVVAPFILGARHPRYAQDQHLALARAQARLEEDVVGEGQPTLQQLGVAHQRLEQVGHAPLLRHGRQKLALLVVPVLLLERQDTRFRRSHDSPWQRGASRTSTYKSKWAGAASHSSRRRSSAHGASAHWPPALRQTRPSARTRWPSIITVCSTTRQGCPALSR